MDKLMDKCSFFNDRTILSINLSINSSRIWPNDEGRQRMKNWRKRLNIKEKPNDHESSGFICWRKERDSNPRCPKRTCRLSRAVQSTTLPSFRGLCFTDQIVCSPESENAHYAHSFAIVQEIDRYFWAENSFCVSTALNPKEITFPLAIASK